MAYEIDQNEQGLEASNETEAFDAGTVPEAEGQQPSGEITDGGVPAEGGEAAAEGPGHNFKWYIIHAYSGFERKVKESLESRVRAYHLEDKVGRIEIPTEPTTELRNGKKYTIDRVFLPGYVF